MDYEAYDQLQASLGCLGAPFESACATIIESSSADEATKALVSGVCRAMRSSLDEVGRSISQTLIASAK